METIYTASYTNIFMGKLELKHVYPCFRGKTIAYLWYIDISTWKETARTAVIHINSK